MNKTRAFSFPVLFEGEALPKQAERFWTLVTEQYIEKISGSGSSVLCRKRADLPAEGFELTVGEDKIVLGFGDDAGARNGLAVLFDGICRENDGYSCRLGTWRESPKSSFRCMLMDMARKYLEPDEVRANLLQMARARMNKVIFHLFDSAHYALQTEVCPILNEKAVMKQYTHAAMRELVDYAEDLGIEVIPSIDFPAHSCYLLECLPELGCQIPAGIEKTVWAVCAGNQAVTDLIKALVAELNTIFHGSYIMIPGDELEFLDLKGQYSYWVNWQHCSVCKAYCEEHGISGKRELYYDFMRRVNDIVRSSGKTLIMGNDNIDISKQVDLPRDILILWWRIAHPGRGPYKGISMKRFLEAGFKVINGRYEDTYIDLYIQDENFESWTPYVRPRAEKRLRNGVVGSCLFAWEGHRHFDWTVPPGICMMGQKLWDHSTSNRMDSVEYRTELTHLVLGPACPKDFDLFSLLGGCFLPQDEDSARMGYPEKVTESQAKSIPAAIALLQEVNQRYLPLKQVYMDCLNWMNAKKRGN